MTHIHLKPLDLIDDVLGHLHNCKSALANCSLVCRAWVYIARRYLFSDLSLRAGNVERFLKSGSFLRPSVRHVELVRWHEDFLRLVGLDNVRSLSLKDVAWRQVTNDQTRGIFLSQFPAITRLSLGELVFDDESQFTQIICALPCLTTLIIRDCFNMQRLSTSSLPATISRPGRVLRLPRSLRTLELDSLGYDGVLLSLLSFRDHLALRTVWLHDLRPTTFELLNEFLSALGPSLETFYLQCYCQEGTPVTISSIIDVECQAIRLGSNRILDLSKNTRLQSLYIKMLRFDHNPSWIAQVISKIVSVHFEELSFVVHLSQLALPTRGDFLDWCEVDTVLVEPQFTTLRKVDVHLVDPLRDGGNPVSFHPYLPKCRARGIRIK